ncbi:MAG: DUF2470 domain-containing protein [Alphaproteobacteria bacterium]
MQAEPIPEIKQRAVIARSLIRGARTAVLSTIMAGDGAPYGSLVLSATHPDAAPLLLLSGLAVHTQNLAGDPRVSLLYDGTGALEDPLTGARLSLAGSIQSVPDGELALCRARFLARHPGAAAYVDFADFSFYQVQPDRAHLVAGFGRINWIEAADLLLAPEQWVTLAGAEADILSHMKNDHSASIALYAEKLLAQPAGPWRMTGCDPEGCDLALGGTCLRLPFDAMAQTAGQVRHELAALSRRARGRQSP